MDRIEKVISIAHVVDVAVIVIRPIGRPHIDKFKPISAVLETRTIFHDYWMAYVEVMLAPEAGAEFLVGNPLVGALRVIAGR